MSHVLLVVVVVIVIIIAFSILFARPRTSCIDMYRAGARKALSNSNANLYTASACAAFPLYSVTGTNIVDANIVYDYPSTCAGTSFVNISTPTLAKIVSAPTETTLVLDVSMAANTLPTIDITFPNSTSTGVAQSSLTVSCNTMVYKSGVNGSTATVSSTLLMPALTGTRCLLVCALRANQVKLMYQTDNMKYSESQLYITTGVSVPSVTSVAANISMSSASTFIVYTCKVYCTDVAISSTAAFDTAITSNPVAPPPTTPVLPSIGAPFKPADYIDRGCWQILEFKDTAPVRNINNLGSKFIYPATVLVNGIPLVTSEYYNYALKTAMQGNYDTFAFKTGWNGTAYVTVINFGNYTNNSFRYDYFGRPADVTTCPEFGDLKRARVYSTVAPTKSYAAADYIDRGCWQDGDFANATPNRNLKAINTSSWDLRTVKWNGVLLTTSTYLAFALQKCMEGGWDTFAFQNGYLLIMGTYNAFNGAYRYDKFGRPPSTATCAAFGGLLINRVYSTVAPKTSYLDADFVDRGCWNDGDFDNMGVYRAIQTINVKNPNASNNDRIALTTVLVNGVALAPAQYFNYGLQLAKAGGYDTFAFNNGNVLYLGNYTSDYRYDKFGKPASTTTCAVLGGTRINRVYSAVAPKLAYTSSQYVDRGCWQDNDFAATGIGRTLTAVADNVIDLSLVIVNGIALPSKDYYNFGAQKAIAGGYDTFAIKNGKFLFLGNYSSMYKYDKMGRPSSTICNALGDVSSLRVYSVAEFNSAMNVVL